MDKSTDADVANVKRIMRYLNTSHGSCINYYKDADPAYIEAYSDADYAGDIDSGKSTTGYVINYCGGPISWCSRKQPIVAQSTTESEFVAAAECCKDVVYLKSFIEELVGHNVEVRLNIDNQSAIKIIRGGQFTRRSKYIDVRYHYVCNCYFEGLIKVLYCSTNEQVADMFTKALPTEVFNKHKNFIVQSRESVKI